MKQQTLPKVLCVDDEPRVLAGLERELSWDFDISTATSGQAALEAMEGETFEVVISDMRMPQMDGASFLAQARQRWPDTTRILLTGQADLQSSIKAINEGQIYRFLTKPCHSATLVSVLGQAVEQYRLVTAEKVLLEQTLRGAVSSLTATLALARSDVFGVAELVRRRADAIFEILADSEPVPWAHSLASELALVPLITLPPTALSAVLEARPLFGQDLKAYDALSGSIDRLLGSIPRLEPVCAILRRQYQRYDSGGEQAPAASRVLRLVTDYEILRDNATEQSALETVSGRRGFYDPALLGPLRATIDANKVQAVVELQTFGLLRVGHVMARPLFTSNGIPLVRKEMQITPPLRERIGNFDHGVGLQLPIYVFADG